MPIRNIRFVKYVFSAAVLAAFTAACVRSNDATAAGVNPTAVNYAAPQITGRTWLKGNAPKSALPLKGKVSVIEFGTFVRNNEPVFSKWRRQFENGKVNIIGVYAPEVASGGDPAKLTRPLELQKAAYSVLIDSGAADRKKWQKSSGLTTYLIDRNARVRYRFDGDLSANKANGEVKMARLIGQLLAEPAPGARTSKGKIMSDKITRTDAEWKALLTPEQYEVLRQHGTERAGTGALLNEHGKGVFLCAGCGNELFSSDTKFESGTGWPSFFKPIDGTAVDEKTDNSYGMRRVEVLCDRCGGHLGHVFEDGPAPTGLRYCMNSAAMKFEKK